MEFDTDFDLFVDDAQVWEDHQVWLDTQAEFEGPDRDEEPLLGEDDDVPDHYWTDN